MMQNFGKCIANPTFIIERPYNKLPIYSINYDFVPTVPDRWKALWVDIKFDPKDFNFQIGDQIIIKSSVKEFVPPSQTLKILDIVGTRIVLSPISPTYSTEKIYPFKAKDDFPNNIWNPTDHAGHWGYSTRDHKSLPSSDQNWLYGHGNPIGYILW